MLYLFSIHFYNPKFNCIIPQNSALGLVVAFELVSRIFHEVRYRSDYGSDLQPRRFVAADRIEIGEVDELIAGWLWYNHLNWSQPGAEQAVEDDILIAYADFVGGNLIIVMNAVVIGYITRVLNGFVSTGKSSEMP